MEYGKIIYTDWANRKNDGNDRLTSKFLEASFNCSDSSSLTCAAENRKTPDESVITQLENYTISHSDARELAHPNIWRERKGKKRKSIFH